MTPYKFRFGTDFPYQRIPFGPELTFKPTSPQDLDKINKFEGDSLPGLMIGYKIKAGGKPTGDTYIIEKSDIESADTAREIYKERTIHISTAFVVKHEK